MQIFTKFKFPDRRSGKNLTGLFKKVGLCSCLIIALSIINAIGASAQTTNRNEATKGTPFVISGKVVDETNGVLAGASVRVLKTKKGTITDSEGKFLLEIDKETDSLSISYVGYQTKNVVIGPQRQFNIQLVPVDKENELNSVVVVGFGTQKKVSLTGSISTIKASELQKSSTPSLSNAIGGKVAGIITRQRSGEPGYDAATVYVRGLATYTGATAPLILVDGVERSMNNINVEEVESFSVLKDASATAVYGIQGANGVILITTKRGAIGKPVIGLRSEVAVLTPQRLPDYINSYEYGLLTNEAKTNLGRPPVYSDVQLQKFKDQSDPYLYPDVNWIDVVLRNRTYQNIHNLNVSGGGDVFRYYTNVGYLSESGIFREDSTVPYPTNTNYQRYNFRSNVDVNLAKNFMVALNLAGIIQNGYYPGTSAFGIFEALNLTPNNAYPIKNPDGSIPGKGTFLAENPFTKTTQKGYEKQFQNGLQTLLTARWDLSDLVTKGLSLQGSFAYDYNNYQSNRRTKNPATFEYYLDGADNKTKYRPISQETALNYSQGNTANRRYQIEFQTNYSRLFGKHNVGAGIFAKRTEYVDLTGGSSLANFPFRKQGLSARATYDYNSRYLFEFTGSYNGSENFPKGKAYGFFPAFAGGWIVSNEAFWHVPAINLLKFRGSHGIVGNDQVGGARFLFQTTINKGATSYREGDAQVSMGTAFAENRIGNEDITWEKAAKTNIGMDLELLKSRIVFDINVFKEHRYDILIPRQQIPYAAGYPSSVIPYANLAIVDNKGIDGSFIFRNTSKGGFFYALEGTCTFARNKIIENDSPIKHYGYQNSRGQAINRPYGYIALGIFQNQAEINSSPSQSYFKASTIPGDIKYQDLNGDNKIDSDDQTFYGYARTPEITYGLGTRFEYKGFDASIYFSGAANTDVFLNGRSTWAFSDGISYNILREYYDNHWVPGADNANVKYPNVTETPNSNNFTTNTIYKVNGNYVRLKTAEIGYNFPKTWTKRVGVNNVRLFINGMNLAVWDHIKIFNPEDDGPNGNYPLTKNFNFGTSISF